MDAAEVYKSLFEMSCADSSVLQYRIKAWASQEPSSRTALNLILIFIYDLEHKWQGLPGEPAAMLAELQKRTDHAKQKEQK